jgi:hypothetical protein
MNVARKKIRIQKEKKAASIPQRTIAVQLFDERDGAAGWNCNVDDVGIISNRVAMLVTLLSCQQLARTQQQHARRPMA